MFLHLAPGRPGPIRTWSATAAGVALAAAGLVPLVPLALVIATPLRCRRLQLFAA